MDSPKKNPDKLNTIGIVTVGAVGSALVYLSIVGLQAFYVNETSQPDSLAAFGKQGEVRQSLKAQQIGHLTEARRMYTTAEGKQVVAVPIEVTKAAIVREARLDPANLVPMVRRSDKATIQPIFGRPIALPPAPPPPPPVDPNAPAAPADPNAPAVPATGEAPAGAAPATGAPAAPAGAAPAAGAQPATVAPPSAPTPPAPSPAPAGAR